jgi:hypothetical protein
VDPATPQDPMVSAEPGRKQGDQDDAIADGDGGVGVPDEPAAGGFATRRFFF